MRIPAEQARRRFGRWAAAPVRETRALGGAVLERVRAVGPAGAPVAILVTAGIAVLATAQFLGVGQPAVEACCAESARLPWQVAVLRLPGSTVAPAQSLPVAGALAQVVLVVGAAELLLGSRAVLVVGAAAQVLSTVAARAMFALGPASPLGLDRVAAGIRDTGPSVVVVAVAVYALARLRLRALLLLTGAALAAQIVAMPDLAGREHLVAALCGLAAAARARGRPLRVLEDESAGGGRRAAAVAGRRSAHRGRRRWAVLAIVALGAVTALDGASMAATRGTVLRPAARRSGTVYVALGVTVEQGRWAQVRPLAARLPLTLAIDVAGHEPPGPLAHGSVAFDPAAPRTWPAVDRSAHRAEPATRPHGTDRERRPPGCFVVVTPRLPAASALLMAKVRHVAFVVGAPLAPGTGPLAEVAAGQHVVVLDGRAVPASRLGAWVGDLVRAAQADGLRVRPLADLLPARC